MSTVTFAPPHAAIGGASGGSLWRLRTWGALEWFIALEYLSTALFFLPGAQALRIPLRALPFLVAGGLMLTTSGTRGTPDAPAGSTMLGIALALLLVCMLNPLTQPIAGIAQLLLQLCIAAPLFWVGRRVESVEHLDRLMRLVLACSAASTIVGLLQVFWPDTFMPAQFNQLAIGFDEKLLTSLSYEGADGRRIIRPPGLTDMPGGAAGGGMLCALFGIAFASQPDTPMRRRVLMTLLSGCGFAVLYFTQVRSILLMTLVSIVAISVLSARQGRPGTAMYSLGLGSLVVVAAFVLATTVGGKAVEERFLSIADQGLVSSYQRERGGFIAYTLEEVLPKYPFGAGVGRWGVMNLYFADHQDPQRRSLHAEIQMTGWIYDGGFLLAIAYGGAVALSLLYSLRVARDARAGAVGYLAILVFCAQLMVAGMTFAGPAFNTQLGIQFWTLAAALHAARARSRATAGGAGRLTTR